MARCHRRSDQRDHQGGLGTDETLGVGRRWHLRQLQPDRRASGSQGAFHYSANVAHLHAGATPVTPLDVLAPGEHRNADYYDNFTVSSKLGFDVTPDFDLGLVARYTNTHLRYTGEDYSTFPAVPAAQQSASNTDEYYGRASRIWCRWMAALIRPRRRLHPQPDGNTATADCGKSQ